MSPQKKIRIFLLVMLVLAFVSTVSAITGIYRRMRERQQLRERIASLEAEVSSTRTEVAQAALRIWADKASVAVIHGTTYAQDADAWGTRTTRLREQITRPQYVERRMSLDELCAEIEAALKEAPQCPYTPFFQLLLEEYGELRELEEEG